MSFYNYVVIYFIYCLLVKTVPISSQQSVTKSLLDLIQPYQNTIIEGPCYCITLIKCPQLYSLISKQPIKSEDVEYLKNLTCGFIGLEPKVCCPNDVKFRPRFNSNSITTPSTTTKNVRRRVDRCLESTDENTFTDHTFKDKDMRHFHFGNHHPFPPYFHPGFKPPSRRFHGKPETGIPPKHLLPNGDDLVPNSNGMNGETGSTAGPIIDRAKLLPDDTCGLSLDQRIVGGKKAKLGAYPWLARLGYTRPRTSVYLYRCGGALINTRFVLTAAHCIDDLPSDLKLATVRLGEMDETTNPDCEGDLCAEQPQDFVPLVIIAHRNYNIPKYKNDIGLIRLDREAIITPYVRPICLPYKFMNSVNYTGVEGIAAGWGTVNIETSSNSPIMQDVSLKVGNLEDCKTIYSSRFQLNVGNSQLCTIGQEGKDTCDGDSGGPLMRFELVGKNDVPRYFMIGIVSYGPKRCGTADLPAVFTRVDSHLDWILFHIDDDYAVIN